MSENKICPKCQGTGQFKKYGECFDCRGSGEMAILRNLLIVIFQGKMYCQGMTLQFTTTASKQQDCEVVSFFHKSSSDQTSKTQTGDVNINDVWYRLVNIKTGKPSIYPLWRSINIQKANTIKYPS